MSGEEIIERLKFIRENVSNVNLPKAMQDIDYLIDDIFMYKNNCLWVNCLKLSKVGVT